MSTKISGLTAGDPIQAADELIIARGSANRKIAFPTLDEIASVMGIGADLNVGGYKVAGMADGTAATDAATKGQVDTAVSTLADLSAASLQTFADAIEATELIASGITGSSGSAALGGRTASGAPASGTWPTGAIVPDETGLLWICTAGGSPGTWTSIGGSGAITVVKDTSDISVASTVTETDILGASGHSITGGSMGTDGIIRIIFPHMYWSRSSGTYSTTVRVYLDSTVIASVTDGPGTASDTGYMVVTITNQGSQSAQSSFIYARRIGTNNVGYVGSGTSTVDTSSARTLRVTVQNSTSSSSLVTTAYAGSILEQL